MEAHHEHKEYYLYTYIIQMIIAIKQECVNLSLFLVLNCGRYYCAEF